MGRNKEIFIHIGMPRAASSSLEENIFHRIENVFHFSRSPVLKEAVNKAQNRLPFAIDHESLRNSIQAELARIQEPKVLISNERLVGNQTQSFVQFHYVKWNLKQLFPEAKVLFIIRRQDEMAESIYKRAVKRGLNMRLASYLNYRNGEFGYEKLFQVGRKHFLNVQDLDYWGMLESYQRDFGEDRIKVLPFELLKHDEEAFFEILYDWIGEKGPIEMGKQNVTGLNRGYSKKAMKLARFINPFFKTPYSRWGFIPINPGFQKLKNKEHITPWDKVRIRLSKMIDPMFWLASGKKLKPHQIPQLLTEHQRKRILEIHEQGNRKVEELTGWDLEPFGYFPKEKENKKS